MTTTRRHDPRDDVAGGDVAGSRVAGDSGSYAGDSVFAGAGSDGAVSDGAVSDAVDGAVSGAVDDAVDGAVGVDGAASGSADVSRAGSDRRGLRRAVRVAAVLMVVAVGYYGVSLWQVWSTGRSDQARSVDAIVVMGAAQYDGRPSPLLSARLDHVIELWLQGYAPIVIVTGGKRPGDRFTEAEASANYLIARGVPESAIVLEDQGSTSFESLDHVAALLDQRSGGDAGSDAGDDASEEAGAGTVRSRWRVLLVTDPFHSLRSRLIAQEVGLTAYVSPTDTSVVTGSRSAQRHIWEAGGVAVGRITGFRWLDELTS
jgi:uncharacterized SAM-binding protein YcdF (DUF218 family)